VAFGFKNWRKRQSADETWRRKGALYNLLSQAGFKVADIGARGGPMLQLLMLSPFAHYFACEPDPVEAERLRTSMNESSLWKNVTVFPEALSTRAGKETLYICNQPGLSSLLRPNPDVVRKYYDDGRFDISRELSVPTITLDQAAARYGFEDACFVKLDTQGTELDILLSGTGLITRAVLGVYVEVEFHPFYDGQPLFSQVDTYLRDAGFSLFDLQRTLIRRTRGRNDLYSRRQVVWADALYFKEPSTLVRFRDDSLLLHSARLLGLALAFEQFDFAFEIAAAALRTPNSSNEWSETITNEIESLALARMRATRKMSKSRRQRPQPEKFFYTDRGRI
jgi:FkbM family methyltransferase